MATLVVGGTGLIGGTIARALADAGETVALAARNQPATATPLAGFETVLGSYIDDELAPETLARFDALVFCAAHDVRQLPRGLDAEGEADFYRRVNSEAVPRFFARARAAGVRRAAYIGSFYPQAWPELIARDSYVRSRKEADEGVRALAGPDFHVTSLNAPWVIGALPGLVPPLCRTLARWGLGRLDLPRRAAPGGTNFISTRSLAQATLGALARGENGRGYLVGDENLRFADFFRLFFAAAGREVELEVCDAPMAAMPDSALLAGRANAIFYPPEGVDTLGYAQGDMARAVGEIVDLVRGEDEA
jgi:dihydroflavonol-4-reductase